MVSEESDGGLAFSHTLLRLSLMVTVLSSGHSSELTVTKTGLGVLLCFKCWSSVTLNVGVSAVESTYAFLMLKSLPSCFTCDGETGWGVSVFFSAS